jgi:hypothetical protein
LSRLHPLAMLSLSVFLARGFPLGAVFHARRSGQG